MNIVWLCPYPIQSLRPELKLQRNVEAHNAPWIVNLAHELVKYSSIKLTIITHAAAITKSQAFSKFGLDFHILRYAFPFLLRGYPDYFPIHKFTNYHSFVNEALKIIHSIKPDVVHGHGTEDAYSRIASNCGLPFLISMQGIIGELYKINPTLNFYLQKKMEVQSILQAPHVAYRTNLDKQYVLSIKSNIQLHYLGEAVNDVFFEHTWQLPREHSLTFVGYLSEMKGINYLINAMPEIISKFPAIILNLVGPVKQGYQAQLKNLIQKKGLNKNIIFHGKLEPPEIARLLSISSIFILPSLMENSPNSLAEAMAVGIPIIASDVGGIPSMIQEQDSGIFIKPACAESISNKVVELLMDPLKMSLLGKKAREAAFLRYRKNNVAARAIEIYKTIIAGGK